MRRVRASFLLRCAILGACVALFVGAVSLQIGTGLTIGSLVLLCVVWVVGIEMGLLPLLIERAVVRRASRKEGPVSSIWFVNLDEQRRRDIDSRHDDTRDNPTNR